MNVESLFENVLKTLNESLDVASRLIEKKDGKIGMIFLKSMTDNLLFSKAVFEPLSKLDSVEFEKVKQCIEPNDVAVVGKDEIVEKIINGAVIVATSKSEQFLAVDLLKFATRVPSEPPTSPVLMGPREGFVEDLKTNLTLLRRRFRSQSLVLEQASVGKITKTQVVIAYLDGVADKNVVKKIRKKLEKADIDGVVDSYYLVSFLSDRPRSILKQVGCSEKPDIVAAKMLEGRVAVIVDNSPIVLTVPFVFFEDMQNSNDYYTNYAFSTFMRVIRVFAFVMAVLGPGVYIALQLFHYNILPIKYLITIADSTQQIPFTPFIEILFISLLFQILYEVSLRLPSYLGMATSIVGALILGDTGVKAGLISPPSVIVVAIAKIALYTIPEQSAQITIAQFVFLMLGSSLGLLGVVGGAIYMITYANSLENFGAPYLAPFSPFVLSDNKDALLKVPLANMNKRPLSLNNKNVYRCNDDEK